MLDDHRLQSDGETIALVIGIFIDGGNANAALDFKDDVSNLVEDYETGYTIGGELITGAALAEEFDDTRIFQILAAGFCVFLIALFVSRSPTRAMRIAVGTIAIGAAVDGFASIIGERGVTLSGGQKQRAALARGLIRMAPILILDDCFSAVDTETEEKILRGLAQHRASATTIIVSNRISTVRHADQILFLLEGNVVEAGTHTSLIEARGHYFELAQQQNARNKTRPAARK